MREHSGFVCVAGWRRVSFSFFPVSRPVLLLLCETHTQQGKKINTLESTGSLSLYVGGDCRMGGSWLTSHKWDKPPVRKNLTTKKKKKGSCMHDEWAPTMSWCRVCIIYVTQVEFLRSQLVRARIKVSVAAETLQQHCATYNEYDPFLNPPQPSNPWLSDDPTYWILNAPAWVTILLFDFFLSFRKQKLACQLSYFWSLGGLTASCSWEEDTKGLVKHKFLLGDTKS